MAKPRREFTEEVARGLKGRPGTLHADPQSVNLSIRFGKTANSWTVLVRAGGRQQWKAIGRVGELPLEDARARAREVVKTARAGPAPVASEAQTFAQVVTAWSEAVGRHQLRWSEKKRRLETILIPEFGHRLFSDIDRTEVVRFLDKIAAKAPSHRRVSKGFGRSADVLKNRKADTRSRRESFSIVIRSR